MFVNVAKRFGKYGTGIPTDSYGNVRYSGKMVSRISNYGFEHGREAMIEKYESKVSKANLAVAKAVLTMRQLGVSEYTQPTPVVIDEFERLPEETLDPDIDDFVRCLKCDFEGVVRVGTDTCPECGDECLVYEAYPD